MLTVMCIVPILSPGGVGMDLCRKRSRATLAVAIAFVAILPGFALAQPAIPWEDGLAAGVQAALQRRDSAPVERLPPPDTSCTSTPLEAELESACTATAEASAEESMLERWRSADSLGCTTAWGDGDEDAAPFLRRNCSFLIGLVGSKQPQDLGINGLFGRRIAVNWGGPVWNLPSLGLQFGTAINYDTNDQQTMELIEGTNGRFQSYTTLGFFQRTPRGFVWGVAYDFLYQDYYDQFMLGQWRGRVGTALGEKNEVGFQMRIRGRGDYGAFDGASLKLEPITQGSLYYQHLWPNDAQMRCFLGFAGEHAQANALLGDLERRGPTLAYGSEIFIPLCNRVALFGEMNFIRPARSGAVDAYFGFEFFPRGGARWGRRGRYAPVLPVASNTTFAIDVQR